MQPAKNSFIVGSTSGPAVGETKMTMSNFSFASKTIIAASVILVSGCQCFRVCPDVPKSPVMAAIHEPCYKHVRSTDPINQILECYVSDIVTFEKEAREREAALGAYK